MLSIGITHTCEVKPFPNPRFEIDGDSPCCGEGVLEGELCIRSRLSGIAGRLSGAVLVNP